MKTFNPSRNDLLEYIERVSTSRVMGRSQRRLKLLEHLLNEEVEGRGHELKAYSIGLDVFAKEADFDPSVDSIVRVEMGRMRLALEAFEGTEFANTKIKLSIPKGSYRPIIELREPDVEVPAPSNSRSWRRAVQFTLGTCFVVFLSWIYMFFLVREDTESGEIVIAVADFEGPEDIAPLVQATFLVGLSHTSSIEVVLADEIKNEVIPTFVLGGTVTRAENGMIVTAELHDTALSRVKWTNSVEAPYVYQLQEAIERSLTGDLRVHLYSAIKDVLEQKDVVDLTPKQLFFLATWVPGADENSAAWEEKRLSLARMALAKAPEKGRAHSVLAERLAFLANVHPPGNVSGVSEEVLYHTQRALQLAPQNPDVLFNVAQGMWHLGRISESERLMKRAVDLDKSHELARFLSNVIPYTCQPAPDDVVQDSIQFDQSLSRSNPIRKITLTWIGRLHINRQEWRPALEAEEAAALVFDVPKASMRRAVALNQLGRTDDALEVLQRQKANWPAVSASHFANVTIPRLCRETENSDEFIRPYKMLAEQMAN